MPNKPRVIFFGTPDFALPSLTLLLERGFDVVAVYTQPDKRIGRKKGLSPSPVKKSSIGHDLPVIQPESLKDDAAYGEFTALAPDLCVLIAYGNIIPARYLDVPRFGFVNVHPSLLPHWRGPSPIQAAILNGDKKTGVSIMLLDDVMDHGPLLAQTEVPLNHTEYYPELRERLAVMGAELLANTLTTHLLDGISPVAQDHDQATFSEKTSRLASRINWTRPAIEVERMVRAYADEPVAWTTWKDMTINILKARAHKHQQPQTRPGTVLGYDNEILVDTPDGALELIEIQPSGKKAMSPQAFANGHPDFLGSRFI